VHFYVHSQPLNIAITGWVDDSNSQSENKPARIKPNETKIKTVTLCAHARWLQIYSFEVYFM